MSYVLADASVASSNNGKYIGYKIYNVKYIGHKIYNVKYIGHKSKKNIYALIIKCMLKPIAQVYRVATTYTYSLGTEKIKNKLVSQLKNEGNIYVS